MRRYARTDSCVGTGDWSLRSRLVRRFLEDLAREGFTRPSLPQGRTLAGGYFRGKVQRAEAGSGMQQVVRLTEQANVPSISRAEQRKGFDVVELEKRPGITASTICRNEPAPTLVAIVSFSPYRHGHVTSTFADRYCAALARSARRRFDCRCG
ncbi:MAG TPA: hypothetical protein VJV79_27010 [Polyangiaceae bacterium]|nr:hypothetical protein [Polyangiaceae bacterium]